MFNVKNMFLQTCQAKKRLVLIKDLSLGQTKVIERILKKNPYPSISEEEGRRYDFHPWQSCYLFLESLHR